MNKIILILFCVLFLSNSVFMQEKLNIDKFLDEVDKGFLTDAKKLNVDYKLGSYERWNADQETGKLIFSDKGKAKVIASFQIVGSYSAVSKTWKWSWANDTIDTAIKQELNKVKDFGEKNDIKQLTTAQWECDEDYAWTLTSIAG